MNGYDVIGDVHGYATSLERLLGAMGYVETAGVYRHPERRVVFVGDLIDRGPDQIRTLQIARSMVESKSALMVLGNHEFNAVAWTTRNTEGEWSRPHSERNRGQHEVFLDAVTEGSARHHDWIDWFRTLPMWLDLGGLRIVHACWHPPSMQQLGGSTLSDTVVTAPGGTDVFEALEVVLKGPEIDMGGASYADKDGRCRHKARLRWWDPSATTIATGSEIPGGVTACDGSPLGPLPDTPLDRNVLPTSTLDVPVLYGHYWRSGADPTIDNASAACLDWSVAKDGPLVAYRWSGEPALTNDHLIAVR